MRLFEFALIILLASLASGCATSPGSPLVGYTLNQEPFGDESVIRGVVNGIYEYSPQKTEQSMAKLDEHLLPEQINLYSKRRLVRVGINRAHPLMVISPIIFGFRFSDFVILPEEWSHDFQSVSNDPHIINVGDIIDIRIQRGRYYDYAVSLVRQCFEEPLDDENPDWAIGCKTYEGYDKQGYAGEKYVFRPF